MVLPALIGAAGSLIGGLLSESGKKKEMAQQKEFAKEGVRWRVADAHAAGVHPAIALGANVPSYSPVGLGDGIAEGVANMGQDIGRAVQATQTLPERLDAYTQQTQALTLERMGLENSILRADLARATNPTFPLVGSDYPIPGQPGSTTIATPFGLPALKVANPGLAQQAQDHFGEPLEWLYGGSNFIDSLARAVGEWSTAPVKEAPPRMRYTYPHQKGG